MKFLWKAFRPLLSPLLYLLSLATNKTPNPYDDWAVGLAEKLAKMFLTEGNEGKDVRAVVAVMMKELLINPRFVKEAGLTSEQSARVLIAILSFVKPEAVDTEEEIKNILAELSRGNILSLPVYTEI